jgi:hypothetical protein
VSSIKALKAQGAEIDRITELQSEFTALGAKIAHEFKFYQQLPDKLL